MREAFPFKLGISAINWANEDVLRLGDHYSGETILSEMASLGYSGTEMSRKFPSHVQSLKALLENKGMSLASQWKGVLFSDAARHNAELEGYRQHVLFLKEMGCKTVVTCELGGSTIGDPRRGENEADVRPLTDFEWNAMIDGLEKAGQICREHDMQLVYHYHMGTNVETKEQIDRLMQESNPELVHLLFDSGHAYYAGAEPMEILAEYADRIKHVHLKDVRKDVLEHVRRDGIDFKSSVLANVFTVPGDGILDFKPILQTLKDQTYSGWIIIEAEQDPDVKNPYTYARLSKQYIDGIWKEIK